MLQLITIVSIDIGAWSMMLHVDVDWGGEGKGWDIEGKIGLPLGVLCKEL